LLAFGLRAAAIVAITTPTATPTPASATAAFVATLAGALSRGITVLVTLAIAGRFVARVTRLVIPRTAVVVLVTATTTSAAVAALIALAVLTFTLFGLWFLRFGGFAAEEIFQPSEETAGGWGGFGGAGRNGVARTSPTWFITAFTARLTRLARLRGETIVVARLKRFLFARFRGATVAATFRAERGTLVTLRTGVFVVGAITPTDGRPFCFGGRQDLDFSPGRCGLGFRLR
jgi:hypothetical protein